MLSERVLRLSSQAAFGILAIGALKPAEFGALSIILAFYSIALALSTLGTDQILVRDLVNFPTKAKTLVPTIIIARVFSGSILTIFCIIGLLLLRSESKEAAIGMAILGVTLIIQSLEVTDQYFIAQSKGYLLAMWRAPLVILLFFVKLWCLFKWPTLLTFISLQATETIILCILTLAQFCSQFLRHNPIEINFNAFRELLSRSYPIFLSTIAVIIYMKLSVFIVAAIAGDHATGLFAAAMRLIDAIGIIPMVIAQIALPTLVTLRKNDPIKYESTLMSYLRLNAFLAYLFTFFLIIAAPTIVSALFGQKYAESEQLIRILAPAIVFVFIGTARSQDLLNHEQQHFSVVFAVSGLVSIVLLGPAFTYLWGLTGICLATAVSYAVSAFFSGFFFPKTRGLAQKQLRALLTPFSFQLPSSKI